MGLVSLSIFSREAKLSYQRDVEDVSTMQGPLAVQEYIQELIRNIKYFLVI